MFVSMCKCFRVAICAVAIVFVVHLIVYAILRVVGRSGFEWVDERGKGNGYCHEMMSIDGESLVRFRLCDYSNTNGIYQLSVFCSTNSCDLSDDMAVVSVAKYSRNNGLVDSSKFTKLFGQFESGFNLPSCYAPKSAGEKLEIQVLIDFVADCDASILAIEKKASKKFTAQLVSKKVVHYPAK